MINWSQYVDEETITDPLGNPLAVRCRDGRIIVAAENAVGRTEQRNVFSFDSATQTYQPGVEEIEIVWSGHRDNGYLCRGIY